MPYPNRKGAARLKIEAYLAAQPGPVMISIIRDGTGLDSKVIANALTALRLDGQLETSGKAPLQSYRLITPAPTTQQPKQPAPPKQAAWSDSKKAWRPAVPRSDAEVIYPPGYRHTVSPAPDHGTYQGADWTKRTLRPECLANESIASRRGDTFVGHRPALGMQTGNPRGTAYHLVPAIKETA